MKNIFASNQPSMFLKMLRLGCATKDVCRAHGMAREQDTVRRSVSGLLRFCCGQNVIFHCKIFLELCGGNFT